MIAATRSQTGATTETPVTRDADTWDQLAGTHRHHHHKSPHTSAGTDLERDMPVSATGDGTPRNADSPHSADARCHVFGAIIGIIFGYSKIDHCVDICLLSANTTAYTIKTKNDRDAYLRSMGGFEKKHRTVKRHVGSVYTVKLHKRICKIREIRNDLAHSTSGVDETKTLTHFEDQQSYSVAFLEQMRDETELCAIEFESAVKRYLNYGGVYGSGVRGI